MKIIGATIAVAATLGAVAAAPAGAYDQNLCMYTTEEWGEVCTSMIVPIAEAEVTCVTYWTDAQGPAGLVHCIPRVD